MTQIVKLKRSAVMGKIPTTGDLALGEIAINSFDGKAYIKKDDGAASIVELGSGDAALEAVNALKVSIALLG